MVVMVRTATVVDWLDKFCSPVSPFWRRGNDSCTLSANSNISCHDIFDVTECFQDTAILYLILTCFWFLAFLRLLCSPSNKPQIPHNYLNFLKRVLCLVLMVIALANLGYTIYKSVNDGKDSVAYYQFLSPIVLALTMLLAFVNIYFERRVGVRSSSLMTLLWLTLVIYGGIKLRTIILLVEDNNDRVSDIYRLTTFCIESLFIVQFILVLISEPKSPYITFRNNERKQCPEETSPFFSQITWWWQNSLFLVGYKRSLTYDDLCDINYNDKSHMTVHKFETRWAKELKKATRSIINRQDTMSDEVSTVYQYDCCCKRQTPSFFIAITTAFGFTYFVGFILRFGKDILGFVNPVMVKLLINYISDPTEPELNGYFYAVIMFIAAVVQTTLSHQYYHRAYITGMRIRAALVGTIYKKALCLSNTARHTYTMGEIVNLMSVDAQRLMDTAYYLHMTWSAPLQIFLALIFLYQTMGPSIFAGFGIMVLITPINIIISAIIKKYQVKQMIKKDSRIKLMNEVLNGIKVVKLYAWEIPFKRMIMATRKEELWILRTCAFLSASLSITWTCAPFMVAIATFTTYSLIHLNDPNNQLTAEKAFVALSLFNILRFPLQRIPVVITIVIQASVSIKRIRLFLLSDEIDPTAVDRTEEPFQEGMDCVSITNGYFTWEDSDNPCLKDINLTVKPGELIAIVGQVGAGKSSLISALLGEMDKINGHVSLRGSIAYVPQQAWIQNATVKDNILFGKQLNTMLYDQSLHACALEQDLEILPGGDMTEIGEKGINLSGGQKQRVSLARSVYQEADVYLLDDPLSAVDSHVGKHIFDKVIGPDGILNHKVRILVTHGLAFLPQCDVIIVMEDGRITEMGTYSELMEHNQSFAEFLQTFDHTNATINAAGEIPRQIPGQIPGQIPPGQNPATSNNCWDYDDTDVTTNAGVSMVSRNNEMKATRYGINIERLPNSKIRKQQPSINGIMIDKEPSERSNLIIKEAIGTGRIKLSVFIAYAKACTFLLILLVIVLGILSSTADIGQNFWLAHWSNQANNNNTNQSDIITNISVYASLGLARAVFFLFWTLLLVQAAIYSSRTLHDNMLSTILRSPMSFFDTTPLGRILNRFSKDVYTIDEIIPRSLDEFVDTFFSVFSTIVVIAIASPWFLVVVAPLIIVYVLIQRFYVATSRQLKRLESVSRSPIYSHFQESITGAASIRAYKQTNRFIQLSHEKVDYNNIAYYPGVCSFRWIAMRLEFIGAIIVLTTALFASLQRNYPDIFGRISPGLAGLSITYALQITLSLNWMVRTTSDLESDIVAVERTKEYSELTSEAPDVNPNNRPPRNWPTEGKVQFDHYSTRYRDDLGLVLKNISADVMGGQKVGIVGRTGAGKSSLTLALFRIIESARGAIFIDGIDIATIGLRDLRSRITIIPQDPVLFSGTLRVNLDPFNSHTDEEIWFALETSHLSQFVNSLEAGLEHNIAEGGDNISVGQRQLVCLARALLRKTKILVLDEATAAVDMETDDLIQKTIRKEFADATVITIAHRLNTIMDYDRVIVLDCGRVEEFGTPNGLLDSKGLFYRMAKDANLIMH